MTVPNKLLFIVSQSFGKPRQLLSIGKSRRRHELQLIGAGLALSAISLCGNVANAQQHNYAALNAVGRFFGVGWSHGYQSSSADGRFQHIKDQHPASMYPSSGMLYPYSPNYSAMQVSYGQPMNQGGHMHPVPGYPTPAPPMYQGNSGFANPNQGNVLHQPGPANQNMQPVQPPKPVEPPPAWLKPFLNKDGEVIDSPAQPNASQDLLEEVVPREGSPSDKGLSKPSSEDDDLLIPQTKLTPMQRYHQAQQLRMTNR